MNELIFKEIADYFGVNVKTVKGTWMHRYKNELIKSGAISMVRTGRKENIVGINKDRFIEVMSKKLNNKRQSDGMAKVIGVANSKGGTGKTTLSNTIASYYANEGYKVLIIDLDPQASQTILLGQEPEQFEGTSHDITRMFNEFQVEPIEIKENLHLMPSNKTLADASESGKPFREIALRNMLRGEYGESYLDKYDIIIIDPPASNGILMTATLIASDYIIIPARLSFLDETGLRTFTQTLYKTLKNVNKRMRMLGIVPMEFERNAVEHLHTIKSFAGYVPNELIGDRISEELKSKLLEVGEYSYYDDLKILETYGLVLPPRDNFILPAIPKRQAWVKAMSMGLSIFDYIESIEPRLLEDEIYKNIINLMENISDTLKLPVLETNH